MLSGQNPPGVSPSWWVKLKIKQSGCPAVAVDNGTRVSTTQDLLPGYGVITQEIHKVLPGIVDRPVTYKHADSTVMVEHKALPQLTARHLQPHAPKARLTVIRRFATYMSVVFWHPLC